MRKRCAFQSGPTISSEHQRQALVRRCSAISELGDRPQAKAPIRQAPACVRGAIADAALDEVAGQNPEKRTGAKKRFPTRTRGNADWRRSAKEIERVIDLCQGELTMLSSLGSGGMPRNRRDEADRFDFVNNRQLKKSASRTRHEPLSFLAVLRPIPGRRDALPSRCLQATGIPVIVSCSRVRCLRRGLCAPTPYQTVKQPVPASAGPSMSLTAQAGLIHCLPSALHLFLNKKLKC